MAMDVPPQKVVEYRIERPSPTLLEGVTKAASTMTRGSRDAADAARMRFEADGRSDLRRMLPPIDLRSRALTRADREALVLASRANREGRLGTTGLVMPRGYVAERIRIAMMLENANRDQASARAFRCQSVATSLNRLAGSFLDGGIQAADRARKAIPGEWLAECRSRLLSQAREAAHREARRGIDPSALSKGTDAPVRIDPGMGSRPLASIEPRQAQLTRIDPIGSRRVSIDPTPSRKVSISPTPSVKVRIDPVPLSKGPETVDGDASTRNAFFARPSRGR